MAIINKGLFPAMPSRNRSKGMMAKTANKVNAAAQRQGADTRHSPIGQSSIGPVSDPLMYGTVHLLFSEVPSLMADS